MIDLVPLDRITDNDIDRLLDDAFGTDRRGRTAYRIREGTTAVPDLSFAATIGKTLVGSIQCWPVRLLCDAGDDHPLVMVGPVAVAPARQGDGIGQRLMMRMIAAAHDRAVDTALMLIGDPEYYGRFFGFSADRTGGWRAPGPVERHRLLARGAAVPDCAGQLGPLPPPIDLPD